MKPTVVLAGGKGFIGKHLVKALQSTYNICIVSRAAAPEKDGVTTLSWDNIRAQGLPKDTKAVVQLAGHKVLRLPRWNEDHKKKVIESRVETAQWLIEAMKKSEKPPEVYVTSSAIGWYPFTTMQDPAFTENAPNATHFTGKVTAEIERMADEATKVVGRAVSVRVGLVLGKDGGLLMNMWWPFYFGVGGKTGDGKQPMPWIHIDDQVALYKHAIECQDVKGPMNAVAPGIVDNYAFTKAFGKAMWRPTVLPVPSFVLKAVMGEESELLLKGSNITPKVALESGFKFKYPTIDSAFKEICG
eukprot:TRINITY_DN112881_c0_g1_i1.p1 TRINITY_DN112881_c0_g1~~TRINITY_DN112881_c0_g1_i1.p1  ORF type:complete len:301 (-),score=28.71 TRINITY_DN112881_c0_g1_i1:45-947(-)